MHVFMLTSNILVIMTYNGSVFLKHTFPVYWYCICYAVSGNQSWKWIDFLNELIFWEDPTLKLCTELRWENVCDCQLGIWSKLHTSLQINKTALCHCNFISMLSVRQHTKIVSHPHDTLFQHHSDSDPQNEYGNIRKQHYCTLPLFILSAVKPVDKWLIAILRAATPISICVSIAEKSRQSPKKHWARILQLGVQSLHNLYLPIWNCN